MKSEPKLVGKYVLLRHVTEKDIDQVVIWRNRDFVRAGFVGKANQTKESLSWFYRHHVETGNAFQFIIVEKKSRICVGTAILRDIDTLNNRAELLIYLGEKLEQKGEYLNEACLLVAKFAFETVGLHKITATLPSEASELIDTFLSAGFSIEATLKEHLFIEKEYKDVVLIGLISKA